MEQPEITRRVGEGPAATESRPFRVLVAEDSYEFRRFLTWALERDGFEVTECADGETLMKTLERLAVADVGRPFDLIVSDVRMPGRSGLRALEAASELGELPPLIVITAFPDDETLESARRVGAARVLEKPFDINTLLGEIRGLLPQSEQRPSWSADQPAVPPFPVKVTLRRCSAAEPVRELAVEMAAKLSQFSDHIDRVHVVVEEAPAHVNGKHNYRITLQVVIHGKLIVVKQDTERRAGRDRLYVGVRDAFGAARRQLKEASKRRLAKRAEW